MTYRHLSRSERIVLDTLRSQGASMRATATLMKRHPSSISRELRRNMDHGSYHPCLANWHATQRRKRTRPKPTRHCQALMDYVIEKLKALWSPQQIAGRLRSVVQEDTLSMRISHETIYDAIREDHRIKGGLFAFLRHARRKYDKRMAPCAQRGRIRDCVSIDERPQSVADQLNVGDWEADTVYGRKGTGFIATLIDRKTLKFMAQKISDLKASTFNGAVIKAFQDIPTQLCKTITCDNGSEFSNFKELQEKLGCQVYFAHPHHPWERGANENANGLLRQFAPKKADFNDFTQEQLDQFVQKLNDRPRRKLNYRTPNEVFSEAIVALQT